MKSNPSVSDWEQILDIMIREIRKQTYGKDQKIPTENEMAARFGVNRSEIRRVYKRLKEFLFRQTLTRSPLPCQRYEFQPQDGRTGTSLSYRKYRSEDHSI